MPGAAEDYAVGETSGYWLNEDDFVSTDGCSVWSLGSLVFPRNWPSVYGQSPALKSLVGKKGRCASERVAVVGVPTAEEKAQAAGLPLQPLRSFANAELLEKSCGLRILRGWAVFERESEPEGAAFVAERYWWNVLPDGKWADFTPRSLPNLLLASALDGAPKSTSLLSAADVRLADHLNSIRFGVAESPGADAAPHPAEVGELEAEVGELEALRAELAATTREADEACRRLRERESEAGVLSKTLGGVSWQPGVNPLGSSPAAAGELRPGSLVRVHGLADAADWNGQEATVVQPRPGGRCRAMLRTGEERTLDPEHLELIDAASESPDLSTFGCEVVGHLRSDAGRLAYNLWPLIYSGIVSVRVPDRLLARLNAQFDTLYSSRSAPSHAPFLQAEMKEGKQVTVRNPDSEYTNLLLACAEKLGGAVLKDEARDFDCVLDQVWTVHQLAGDYNPMHFHTNGSSHFGFSSFLHLQLPPQLSTRQQRQPETGSRGHHDGVTSFHWKTDSGMAREQLESPGVLECDLVEGRLYVFPQWVQHLVWPFRGPGERRTVAANVGLVPR